MRGWAGDIGRWNALRRAFSGFGTPPPLRPSSQRSMFRTQGLTLLPASYHLSAGFLDTCHLWQVALTSEPRGAVLDAAELARAARFRFDRDRERFMVCRAALRTILAGYLDRDPARISFAVGAHGRPHLPQGERLEFNVSHSGELALIAVSGSPPLGVDVEAVREVPRAADLAARYMHPDERELIENGTPLERNLRFLKCWTRKEAVLKSTGVGLTLNLKKINLAASSENFLDLPQLPPLRLVSLKPADGYIAACATAVEVRHFELHRFLP